MGFEEIDLVQLGELIAAVLVDGKVRESALANPNVEVRRSEEAGKDHPRRLEVTALRRIQVEARRRELGFHHQEEPNLLAQRPGRQNVEA